VQKAWSFAQKGCLFAVEMSKQIVQLRWVTTLWNIAIKSFLLKPFRKVSSHD